jgi:Flp pilus assembly protein TadG
MKINSGRSFKRKSTAADAVGAFARVLSEESGSAIVEFILFTLPLIVPLAIFLTTTSLSSSLQFDLNNYSRQLVRAYVTSPDQTQAGIRTQEVSDAFIQKIFIHDAISVNPSYSIICSLSPCLTPGGTVRVDVSAENSSTHREVTASTTELVDQWR